MAWSKLGHSRFSMPIQDKLLAAAVPVLAAWLAGLIFHRCLHKRFPFFLTYLISIVLIAIARFASVGNFSAYKFTYMVTDVLYAILALLALHEIFRYVFWGFYEQFLWFRLLFPTVIVLSLALVVGDALRLPPSHAGPLPRLIVFLGIAVNFIQIGLFCMFMLAATVFGLRWRQTPLGISLGFAIAAAGSLTSYWLDSEFGTKIKILTRYASPVAFFVAMAVWLVTFVRPEPEPTWPSSVNLQRLLEIVRQDTVAMKRFLEKIK